MLNCGNLISTSRHFPKNWLLDSAGLQFIDAVAVGWPKRECALPFFFARDLEKRGSTCSFALCRDVVARVPSTFWFWVWENDWEDHTLHVCGNVEWFARIFALLGLVIEWNVISEVAAWSEIASFSFWGSWSAAKNLSCLLQLRTDVKGHQSSREINYSNSKRPFSGGFLLRFLCRKNHTTRSHWA